MIDPLYMILIPMATSVISAATCSWVTIAVLKNDMSWVKEKITAHEEHDIARFEEEKSERYKLRHEISAIGNKVATLEGRLHGTD